MNRAPHRWLGWILLAIMIAIYTWWQVVPLLGDRDTGVAGLASHANDYKHVYLGSVLLFEGLNPYDPEAMLTTAGGWSQTVDPRFRTLMPYVYLPFTGLAMRPFSLLSFAQSVVAFQVFNHLALMVAIALLAWSSGLWKRLGPWAPTLLLASIALSAALFRQNNAGQLNVVLLLGYALVYTAEQRRAHPALTGLLAAFGALFKLSPGILIVWFLLRRRWHEALWMTAWGIALMLLSIGIFGWRVHLEFLPVLRDMGYGRSTWAEFGNSFWRDPYNQSINATMHRLFVDWPTGGMSALVNLGPAAANAMTWACSLGILAATGFAVLTRTSDARPAFAALVGASLLLPSICWDHYLVQALVMVALLGAVAVERRSVLGGVVLIAATALMAVTLRFDAFGYTAGLGLVLYSAKLPALLALFALAVWWSVKPGSSSPLSEPAPPSAS